MTYKFEIYHHSFLEHVKSHLANSKKAGSIFTNPKLQTPRQIADYAWEKIKNRYAGRRMGIEIDCGEVVGLEALVPISELPSKTKTKREIRGRGKDLTGRAKGYTVWIAYGIKKPETTKLTIIAGPVKGNENIHAFESVYPGRWAPDFTNSKFWNTHAFIR